MVHVCLDTSKYPRKPFVNFCQIKVIKGHEFKKVKCKVLSLGGVMHVFESKFRQ